MGPGADQVRNRPPIFFSETVNSPIERMDKTFRVSLEKLGDATLLEFAAGTSMPYYTYFLIYIYIENMIGT